MAGNEQYEVDPKGPSFLLLKECLTRRENVVLRMQMAQSQFNELQGQQKTVGEEVTTFLKQLSAEVGISDDDFEKYNLDMAQMKFVPVEEPDKKATAKKKRSTKKKKTTKAGSNGK